MLYNVLLYCSWKEKGNFNLAQIDFFKIAHQFYFTGYYLWWCNIHVQVTFSASKLSNLRRKKISRWSLVTDKNKKCKKCIAEKNRHILCWRVSDTLFWYLSNSSITPRINASWPLNAHISLLRISLCYAIREKVLKRSEVTQQRRTTTEKYLLRG